MYVCNTYIIIFSSSRRLIRRRGLQQTLYLYMYIYSRGYRYGWNARRAPMPDDPNSILIRDDGLFGSYAIFFFFEVRVCFLISEKKQSKNGSVVDDKRVSLVVKLFSDVHYNNNVLGSAHLFRARNIVFKPVPA